MDRCHCFAVQGGIQFAPLACGRNGADRQIHGRNHLRNDHGVCGEHLTQQGDGGLDTSRLAGCSHGASHGFLAGIVQHGASQHIFGLGMGGHTKPWHIDANDANTVDFFGQQLKRHTTGGGHTQVDDDDAVKLLRVRLSVNRLTNVLEQFAGHQGFGIEGHIAHGSASTIEMRGEGETVHAAGRAAQDGGGATHTQTHTQGTKCRAHALRLVVGTLGIVGGVLRQHFALARFGRRIQHLVFARMTTQTISAGGSGIGQRSDGNDVAHGIHTSS